VVGNKTNGSFSTTKHMKINDRTLNELIVPGKGRIPLMQK